MSMLSSFCPLCLYSSYSGDPMTVSNATCYTFVSFHLFGKCSPQSKCHFTLLHQNIFIHRLSAPKQVCLVFLQPLSSSFHLQVIKSCLMRKLCLHIYLLVCNERSNWPTYFISSSLQRLLGYFLPILS